MKIVEIGTGYTSIPANKGAATEIVVDNLSRALIKAGHDVTVVDIADPNRLPTELPIVEVGMPRGLGATDEALGIRHKLKRVVYSIRLASVLKRLVRESDERVVLHFHNQYNLYFFLKMGGGRCRDRALIAYTVHSYVWHDPWEQIEGTVGKRYFQEIRCMQQADEVFVLNEQTALTAVERLGVSPSRVVRIANGIDAEAYRPFPEGERERVRVGMGLSGKVPFIQVGSVCSRKNQLEAVEMLAPLMKADHRVCFIYAGGIIDDEYQAKILQRAKELGVFGQVSYLGEIEPGMKLNECYNAAVAMVFPAKAEAFGLCIVEAMAAGLPVLVRADLKVPIDGLLPYASKDEFAEIVAGRILDRSEMSVLSARSRSIAEGYSWDVVAGEYFRRFAQLGD